MIEGISRRIIKDTLTWQGNHCQSPFLFEVVKMFVACLIWKVNWWGKCWQNILSKLPALLFIVCFWPPWWEMTSVRRNQTVHDGWTRNNIVLGTSWLAFQIFILGEVNKEIILELCNTLKSWEGWYVKRLIRWYRGRTTTWPSCYY